MRRAYWLLLPLAFIGVTVVGLCLQPNPAGLGTHTALGLPKCLFLEWTGLPCPGCGLTTSFVHLLHGHWRAAFAANPLGPPLFLAFGLAAFAALGEFFRHRTPLGRFLRGEGQAWIFAALALYLGTWFFRLYGLWQKGQFL
ncbi:MAG: DUF2752 domain-containing protein [bacterium]